MAVNAKPAWLNPGFITMCQIAQMLIGTTLCAMTYSLLGTTNCSVKRENVIAGGLMYGSYLYLFTDFACKRFFKETKMNPNAKVKKLL
jgi:hypothetical protein